MGIPFDMLDETSGRKITQNMFDYMNVIFETKSKDIGSCVLCHNQPIEGEEDIIPMELSPLTFQKMDHQHH